MLSVFEFNSTSVRVLVIDGEPWFVSVDIACILGYADPSKMTNLVDDEDKRNINPQDTPSLAESFSSNAFRATVVNESGLYSCIFGSTKPEAKTFKRLVTTEILPSIRKNGVYSNKELTRLEILKLATEAEEGRLLAEAQVKHLEAKIEKDAPLVGFAEKVAIAVNEISFADMAKMLGTGRNRLVAKLRELGVIQKNGAIPYQQYCEGKEPWFKVTETLHNGGSAGTIRTYATARVTGKGQIKIAELIGKQVQGNGIVQIGKAS